MKDVMKEGGGGIFKNVRGHQRGDVTRYGLSVYPSRPSSW
jgi:hypothetical protein